MNEFNKLVTVMWTGWCSKCETRFPFSASKDSPHPHKRCPRCSTLLKELKEFGRAERWNRPKKGPVELKAEEPLSEIPDTPISLDFDELV